MNKYQFIEIRETKKGQVAYILDTVRGVVVIAPVKNLADDFGDEESNTDTQTYRPRVRRRPAVLTPEDVDNLPDPAAPVAPARPVRPRVKPNSIIPPHLRGVFVKPGHKGEDTETREV